MTNSHTVLFLGDIVARSGREALTQDLPALRRQTEASFVAVNGENASGGLGITGVQFDEIKNAGVDCITLGDHTYHRKEVRSFLSKMSAPPRLIRPVNFPDENPGSGWTCLETPQGLIVVTNIMGRTFMNTLLSCPFRRFDELWPKVSSLSKTVIVDFHGEATSEKIAFARHVTGRASLVVGTHTHVQTADEQVLGNYTGYISDLGMSGSQQGVIGMKSEVAIGRFMTGLPEAYTADESAGVLNGIHASIDAETGRCENIRRIRNSSLQPYL